MGGPQEGTISTCHVAEEVVSDDDDNDEKEIDCSFAPEERDIDEGNLARLLVVVGWELVLHDEGDYPEL